MKTYLFASWGLFARKSIVYIIERRFFF